MGLSGIGLRARVCKDSYLISHHSPFFFIWFCPETSRQIPGESVLLTHTPECLALHKYLSNQWMQELENEFLFLHYFIINRKFYISIHTVGADTVGKTPRLLFLASSPRPKVATAPKKGTFIWKCLGAIPTPPPRIASGQWLPNMGFKILAPLLWMGKLWDAIYALELSVGPGWTSCPCSVSPPPPPPYSRPACFLTTSQASAGSSPLYTTWANLPLTCPAFLGTWTKTEADNQLSIALCQKFIKPKPVSYQPLNILL